MQKDAAAIQVDVTEEAIKKARSDHAYKCQRKGHEEQFLFNTEVAACSSKKDQATLQQMTVNLKKDTDMTTES